jgi:hypothetical protein
MAAQVTQKGPPDEKKWLTLAQAKDLAELFGTTPGQIARDWGSLAPLSEIPEPLRARRAAQLLKDLNPLNKKSGA